MVKSDLQETTKLNQWWKPKATNLLVVLYTVMLITNLAPPIALLLFFPSLITILGIGSFGHLVNDWSDAESDLLVGKPNSLALKPLSQKWGWLFLSLITALLPWGILPFDHISLSLIGLEFLLLIIYAVPPLRLKEKKILPIIIDSAYAYTVPALLASHTFFLAKGVNDPLWFLGFLFLWQLALGSRHFLNHLALDRDNDIQSNTNTLATLKGNRYIHQLVSRFIFPVEILTFLVLLVVTAQYHIWFAVSVAILWFICNFFSLILALGRDYPFFGYRFSKMTIDIFYQNYLPIIPLVFLAFTNWVYIFLVLAHVLLFFHFRGRFFFQDMQVPRSFISRYLVYYPAVFLLSPFYFMNKLINAKQISKDSAVSKVLKSNEEPSPLKGMDSQKFVNIALVNSNKSKYTETFIWKMIPKLPYRIFFLHSGDLPLYDNDDRHFLSNWPSLQKLADFIETVFRLEPNYFLKQSITNYLYAKKIRLVIAEFGPVGVQMLPITKDLGIPLIVNFHGYDIFNKQIVDQMIDEYQILFKQAKRIIGVSELMLTRLAELGAPKEKLVHLPAFTDLMLFPPSDHSSRPPNFLAVGRFSETKSPHLTLLAFEEVVRRIPHATLTFIGKGGGGELYEACLIMAKALGLEKNVYFKGALNHVAVAKAMKGARVFVQHSITTPENNDMEGKPVAVMEAMASGLPIITTRHSGIVELIDHTISGILVDEYDIKTMATWMIKLATDDELVKQLGKNASEEIRANPLITNHIEALGEIIEAAL